MSGTLKWDGLSELRAALLKLPADLRDEAKGIVQSTAHRVAEKLKAVYPEGDTGNLRKGVVVQSTAEHDQGFGTAAVVRSKSPHAHIWEFGTQVRKTRQGWNRGKALKHDGLASIAARERKVMNRQLVAVVKKAGFDVTGEP